MSCKDDADDTQAETMGTLIAPSVHAPSLSPLREDGAHIDLRVRVCIHRRTHGGISKISGRNGQHRHSGRRTRRGAPDHDRAWTHTASAPPSPDIGRRQTQRPCSPSSASSFLPRTLLGGLALPRHPSRAGAPPCMRVGGGWGGGGTMPIQTHADAWSGCGPAEGGILPEETRDVCNPAPQS